MNKRNKLIVILCCVIAAIVVAGICATVVCTRRSEAKTEKLSSVSGSVENATAEPAQSAALSGSTVETGSKDLENTATPNEGYEETVTFDDDFAVVIGVDAGTDGWQSAESDGNTSETGSSWG